MGSANLQGDEFSDSQESRAEAAKLSIWAVATGKDFYLLMLIDAFSGCESLNMVNVVQQGIRLAIFQ